MTFPAELPVSARRDDIASAIEANQVVIVAGETGSGKTTQLPKICLALGRGGRRTIGHTQPRRIAARTVAARIAEECKVELGGGIGYAVRFSDRTSRDTAVKVMTDGLLLSEIRRDPDLRRYDTIIVDEAHERSLSIDFLLGYLRRLLPRRKDLKVIITSATIDPERFAELFSGPDGPAPIIEVSGRTYPVEKRYRALAERDDSDQLQAISDAVDELATEAPGDVLIFLSGEREIRDTADLLERRQLRNTEILPLYARLSTAEQQRVFKPHTGRRIILATNVAETSLTVPGIKYVIDPGTARISRYSQRLKVQRLPIEPISQASANQRAGRCGRTSDGICIRLYSEEDYESRPEFTEPEILRTSLASVILSMISLGLGELSAFPFPDPPDRRAVRDGVALLHELGAIDEAGKRLTDVGRAIAELPLDPRLARMLVEADRNGCLREVLVIAAGLSIQDPRERPAERRDAADASHRRFGSPDSDFAAYLDLWRYLREKRRELSGNQYRRMCRTEFLHYLRIREWQDVHTQLRQSVRELGMNLNEAEPSDDAIHQSLLSGLLSHVGLREGDTREYVGARNARFAIFPGSPVGKKPPRWVMAAELVETSRLWARTAARINPDWIEPLAQHLVKRSYSEPHWSKRRGAVMAREKVTLYGVPIVVDRPVTYGKIDPPVSRELFIRHALVQGEWSTRHQFFHRNRRMLEDVSELEDRVRRRDLLVDDDTLFAFYDERLPDTIVSGRHFDSWWKRRRKRDADLLDFEKSLLLRSDADVDATVDQFPDVWTSESTSLPLTYEFEPGAASDGVTVDVPLEELHTIDADAFWWQVPGHREELVAALIRTLPKGLRRNFVPAGVTARRVLSTVGPQDGPMPTVLANALQRIGGLEISADDFAPDRLPDHLRMRFRVVDGERTVGEGKDLAQLRDDLRPRLQSVLTDAADRLSRDGITDWDFGDLPADIEVERHGHQVRGYPTLVDRGASVSIAVVEDSDEQAYGMTRGVTRLIALTTPSPVAAVTKTFDNRTKLTLADSPYRSVLDLLEDARDAAIDVLVGRHGGPVNDADAFVRLREAVRADTFDACAAVVRDVADVLAARQVLMRELDAAPGSLHTVADDIRVQVSWLIYDGFVRETGADQLRHVSRYLRAASTRLGRAPHALVADAAAMSDVQDLEADYYAATEGMRPEQLAAPRVRDARWALEELRVSLFAQSLGTAHPVSVKRVRKLLAQLR
ncbi:ATP-dependent RNA helicase HrpA [Solicola gregarius]|uniref:ATP-dependent RNA helicase HrpA n=1 Tax=Solicola gregarius TaxID=2908642 RepID=A0AA46YNS2_9ACTN|nr:ATP-dependent RNA helicase HrpA [Solicola gregarius]